MYKLLALGLFLLFILTGCHSTVQPLNTSNDFGFSKGSAVSTPDLATQVGLKNCTICQSGRELGAYQVQVINFENSLLLVLPTQSFFYLNSPRLKMSAAPALDQIAAGLHHFPCSNISIKAFTDNVANDSWNFHLSNAQAQEIAMALWDRGVQCPSLRRLTYLGKGSASPIASNLTLRGMSLNRRIEIWVSPVEYSQPLVS